MNINFFGGGEPGCLYLFDWRFKFGSYERVQVSSEKVVTFPLVSVQQVLCGCVVLPLLHLGNFMGYPTRCKFALTQNVEHSFVIHIKIHTWSLYVGTKF